MPTRSLVVVLAAALHCGAVSPPPLLLLPLAGRCWSLKSTPLSGHTTLYHPPARRMRLATQTIDRHWYVYTARFGRRGFRCAWGRRWQ
ncbi:hypothetical protein BC567DRAFT_236340 [Phyllosticta citribraziliensis]